MKFLAENYGIGTPVIALVLLLILVFSGKKFRENWKIQGANWKVKCWISGTLALLSFLVLAFVPLVG